jgi:hypothetical protein
LNEIYGILKLTDEKLQPITTKMIDNLKQNLLEDVILLLTFLSKAKQVFGADLI